jgi:regulator of sirC expression with transglutaminase-like and TPR domain
MMVRRQRELIRSVFQDAVCRDDDSIDLARAALLIAAEEYPSLDPDVYLEKLDRFSDLARPGAESAIDAYAAVLAINAALFDELGFRGNRDNYFDPRNSFLNEVIDRRTGIPITLTVVYMEVARRVGVKVSGVGLPAHFIAKHSRGDTEILIDPFNAGRILNSGECAAMVAELTAGRVRLAPAHLAGVTKKQILVRMLSNLLGVYSRGGDYSRALAALERVLLIEPDSPPHIRDHGLLLAAMGERTAAARELGRYLDLAPDARDADDIKNQITNIMQGRASLN